MHHYSVVPLVVKRFLTGFCFSALAASSWLSAQPENYLPQGLQTGDRVPDDILPETMARLFAGFSNAVVCFSVSDPGESGRA